MSRAVRPIYVGDWWAETDMSTSIDGVDHTGFALGTNTLECERNFADHPSRRLRGNWICSTKNSTESTSLFSQADQS